MPPGHTKVDGWLDFKRTIWHLSQARLNIQEELYGCATGQSQGYTHAWPLALVLRFICLLCVGMGTGAVKGQLAGTNAFLPQCGFQELISGLQALQQAPYWLSHFAGPLLKSF